MRTVRRLLLALTLAMAASGCADGNEETAMQPVPALRAQCVGRHQISLPDGFELEYAASSATLYFGHGVDFETVEFQVAAEGVEVDDFVAVVGSRAAEISAETNEKTGGPMLVAHEELEGDAFLLRYHRSEMSDRSHVHEVHRLVDGVHVFLKAPSYKGVTAPVEARLKELAARVARVAQPAGPGFCIGPVMLDAGNDYEVATIRYRHAGARNRDVSVQVELGTFNRDDAEPRLVRRLEGNFRGLGFKPKPLRKGSARLAGMPAEEWLGSEQVEDRQEHIFAIESYPAAPGLATPTIQVTLGTGGTLPPRGLPGLPPYRSPAEGAAWMGEPVTSSLTDAQALALWDAMIQSMAPR